MGVFADLLANAQSIADGGVGEQRAIHNEIVALQTQLGGDIEYPTGYDAANEVQVIGAATGAASGTYTLEVTLANGETFTTAAIAFDANAATIEAAIDTAADGVVTGFTAGDISVTGGPLSTTDVTLTFDGDSVDGANHALTVVDDALLVGGTAGDVEATTEGQSARSVLAVLNRLGVITGDIPTQGESASLTSGSTRMTNPFYPEQSLIRQLAREAAIQDGNADIETEILRTAGLTLDGR